MADLKPRAAIVGGGIGGLAAAIGLRSAGWIVTVYERAPRFTEVGAGLALGPSALAALDALGVSDEIRATAIADRPAEVRNQHGRTLISGKLSDITGGEDFVLIHRADLIATLVSALPSDCLRAGTPVLGATPRGTVRTYSGTTGYDLVVAADGINSTTRQQIWPHALPARRTGITAWRWIIDAPPPEFIGLVWGVRAEFGVLPLAGDRTYAYAGTRTGTAGLSEFDDWPHPIPQLVSAVSPQCIIRNDLLELPIPKSWFRERIALLGDAAHGMRPTLGQGVGMALEDAVTLAAMAPDLASYARARATRVRRIAAISRHGSWLAEPGSSVVARFRDRAATTVPPKLLLGAGRLSMRRLVNAWTPPPVPVTGRDARPIPRIVGAAAVPTKGEPSMNRHEDHPVVSVDNVSRHYQMGGVRVDALNDVSLSIDGGEFVSIVGPSGAGKSTLLHLMGALDQPDSGSITIDGNRLESMDELVQSKFRLHHVGFVFQFFNLLPHLSAWENVALPKLYDGARLGRVRKEAVTLLGRVGMANRTEHRPAELSGGQMQRVAIARALVMNPRVVLADEPTGNLDSKSGREILTLLGEITASDSRVVAMVTHDADAAAAADRTVEMRDGAITTQHHRQHA